MHLEGRAILWHQRFVKLKGNEVYASCEEYVKALGARFGSHAFDDPAAHLGNLRQPSSLQEHLDSYDVLYPIAGILETMP